MPPQITFVKITDNLSIPIKIFVKKTSTTTTTTSTTTKPTSKSIEINSKYLITVNYQPYQIQLSKNHLNSIINKLKPKILPILIYNNDNDNDLQESQPLTNIETKQLIIDNLKIIIPQQTILNIRTRLGLINYENISNEVEILSLWKKITNNNNNNNLKMLTVKKKFKFNGNQQEDEDKDSKEINFKLKQNYIIDNLNDCIKVYVN
ncbi:conserved hypothetical protein [Candida dubliniensis CD36]|uniref:Uncharacterized protein n=1 Tax=Candida dubliniensis (strain CD36 / ATCC MYA-646 / CBS 7987 / NCPF 3949 / NRRL Y-17841) TaxID=573826 RepID=B9W823_CANDC|nr:conserved hypothetical protein [Candida dubliniensis CD36]CAX44839.1 conserved hypothetical protein [Candida dubliniensis CD36]